MRTYVYVDGFNLYYGALKDSGDKWLDLKALFTAILRPQNKIQKIKYYTARVSARPGDLDAATWQDIYLKALELHIPELTIILGRFLQKQVTMRLVTPLAGRESVKVIKTEEKGSDVNLAVHLVHDGWQNLYDCAVVCSNDGDLSEALRIVRRHLHKTVILAVPGDPTKRPPSVELKRWASYTIQIKPAVYTACHLPNPIPGTTLHEPVGW
jgi:uncharacterized LabA/DUF88 family protein